MAEAQPLSARGEVVVEEPTTAQRTVARRTAEARATIPHLEMSTDVEMTAGRASAEPDLTALLVSATALALRESPYANAAYRDGHYELYSRVNVGVVVAAGDTYAIPTVFDADAKTLAEVAAEIDELGRGARERTLAAPAFAGATFTIWNAGAHGLTTSGIVINPPQAGALAFGAIRQPTGLMTITLAADHRILYGDRAAGFLRKVKARLEDR